MQMNLDLRNLNSEPMKSRMHVIVEGLVQGVNFRYYTRQKALELGLTGWVKNRHDGKVESIFEGDENAVEQIVDWCRQGPPAAEVFNISVRKEEWRGEFKEFRVVH